MAAATGRMSQSNCHIHAHVYARTWPHHLARASSTAISGVPTSRRHRRSRTRAEYRFSKGRGRAVAINGTDATTAPTTAAANTSYQPIQLSMIHLARIKPNVERDIISKVACRRTFWLRWLLLRRMFWLRWLWAWPTPLTRLTWISLLLKICNLLGQVVLMMILMVTWLQNGSAVSEFRVGLEIFAIVAPVKYL